MRKLMSTIFDYRFMTPKQFGEAIHQDYYVNRLNDGLSLSALIEEALAARDAAREPQAMTLDEYHAAIDRGPPPCPAGTHDFDFATWTCRKCGSGIQMINAPASPNHGAIPEPRKPTQRELDLHRAVGRMRALG